MTRLVLVGLAKYTSSAGNCWPSIDIIVLHTGLGRRTVVRHLAEAKASGWISVRNRGKSGQGWRRNAYAPVFPRGVTPAPPVEDRNAAAALRLPQGGARECENVVPENTKRGATVALEQEKKQKKRKEESAKRRPDGLPTSVSDDLWRDFLDHRKSIRKPMTAKAVSMLVSKLTSFESAGHSAAEALGESIMNGWTGVFPPKPGDNLGKPSQRRVSPSDHLMTAYD